MKRFISIATLFLVTSQAQAAGLPPSVSSHSITFEEATELALHANLDLLAAKYNITSAEADELTAGLWNNPSILVDTIFQPFTAGWNQTTVGGPRQYDVILSYPFDLSGKRSASMKSAHEAKRMAEATFQDAVRQKILQVRLAYIDLLAAVNQVNLSRERKESMSRLLTMIQNRIGSSGRLPLLQRRARLALDQAELDVRQREVGLRTAATSLAILIGRPPVEGSVEAGSKLREMKLVRIPPLDQVIDAALESRPDLQALKFNTVKAGYDMDLAHAQVWDNFTITAGLSHQGSSSPNPGDPNSATIPGAYSWDAGITIPLPVFNRQQGAIQKAGVELNQAEAQIQALTLSIRQEIGADYEQLKLNDGLIHDYEETQLDNARKVRDSQQTIFGTGGSGLLDYFDAVNAYQGTLSAYYDVVAEYRRGLARLNAAIGKDSL